MTSVILLLHLFFQMLPGDRKRSATQARCICCTDAQDTCPQLHVPISDQDSNTTTHSHLFTTDSVINKTHFEQEFTMNSQLNVQSSENPVSYTSAGLHNRAQPSRLFENSVTTQGLVDHCDIIQSRSTTNKGSGKIKKKITKKLKSPTSTRRKTKTNFTNVLTNSTSVVSVSASPIMSSTRAQEIVRNTLEPANKKKKSRRTTHLDNSRMEIPADLITWDYTHTPVVHAQVTQSGHTFTDIPFPQPRQWTANRTKHRVPTPGQGTAAIHMPAAAQQQHISLHPGFEDTYTDITRPLPAQSAANGSQDRVPTPGLATAAHHIPAAAGQRHINLHPGIQQDDTSTTDSEDTDTSASSDEEDLNRLGAKYVQKNFNTTIPGINVGHYAHYAEPISSPISLQIPKKLKKKIWKNQFIDLATLLPRVNSSNIANNFSFQVTSGSQLSLIPNQNTKKIYNIETWTTAFLWYIAVYTEKFPLETPQLIKYTEIVRDLAKRSSGQSWFFYDQQFRTLRENQPIPWDRLHMEFWIMASHSNLPFQRQSRPFRPFRSNRPFGQQSNRNTRFIERTCWA